MNARPSYILLIVMLLCASGCGEPSNSIPDRDTQTHEKTPPVFAHTAAWHPRQTVNGRVVLRRRVTLRAAHAGRVSDCPSKVGQTVTRGQVLLHLSGPRIESPRRMLQDDVALLGARRIKAQNDMDRFSGLLAKGLISENDKGLVAARGTLHEQDLATAKARDELEQLDAAATLTVPVDGRIVELLVRDGSDVASDDPVAVLSLPSEVAIEAPVFAMHGIRLREGLRADVYFDLNSDPIALRVDYLLPRAERDTGAVIVGILPGPHAARLRSGRRVRINLVDDDVEVVAVPSAAVVSRGGKTYCIRRAEDRWQAVTVVVVDTDATGLTYLSGGLNAGDEVLAHGAYGVLYRDFRELFTFED